MLLPPNLADLNADIEGMEQMAVQVLQNAQTILDKVKIYEISIVARSAESRDCRSYRSSKRCTRQLGVELPTEPDEVRLGKALEPARQCSRQKN